ncbi:unnamed protein product, partial [Meganyctiphanes norvegica]
PTAPELQETHMKSPYYLFASLALAISIASGHLPEDGILPRSCQDIREQGFVLVRHYVVYHTVNTNTELATMIYCDEKDGMQLPEEEDGTKHRTVAMNCKDLQDQGMNSDGYGTIYPLLEYPDTTVLVLCIQTINGGGWTVISHRDENYDNPTDFNKTFEEYAEGFGDVNYDFYIGNEVIHSLTDSTMNELWVDIEDIKGRTGYAHYKYFHVGPKDPLQDKPPYMMDSGFYEGTIGEGLGYHNGMGFSTWDQDSDIFSSNCARDIGGGWWYKNCVMSHLNGLYGSEWFRWVTNFSEFILSKAQMMVRPLKCT